MSENPMTPGRQRREYAPFVLAIILTTGYFTTLWYLLTHEIPEVSQRVIDVMIGNLTIVWSGSMAYFYSTTAGSSKKTELLAHADPIKE